MPAEDRQHEYIIALGSNRRHHRYGSPRQTVEAAFAALARNDITVLNCSRIFTTFPIGPSTRAYANAAVTVASNLAPDSLLHELKEIEAEFGSRRGQRWSARTLDLDIILWGGGSFHSSNVTIPHTLFRTRDFVLKPLMSVAPSWVDPITNLSVRHLFTRLTKKQRKEG
uniref:2-amino-4-hydroxy-6-hydroxymethyldihydropteridine diphosphokinase n=1 Tax=uncultured bacterium TB310_p TaxID=1552140 RepID=A0A0K0LBJ7_9BACT|nr:7, 8-dihydro-6-hydroxymethylpterin-pyrophosphokinase [uncultured bacterium TB310_p]